MFTGLRNANIRVDLREMWKNNYTIDDELLFKYISEATANETERSEKLVNAKKNVVNVDLVEKSASSNEKYKENLFTKIEEMKAFHAKEMSMLRADLLEIKNTLKAVNNSNENLPKRCGVNQVPPRFLQQNSRRNFRKCKNCEATDARCYHCFNCGSSEHRIVTCPVSKQKKQ